MRGRRPARHRSVLHVLSIALIAVIILLVPAGTLAGASPMPAAPVGLPIDRADAEPGDRVGASVATDGNLVALGIPGDDTLGDRAGAVGVFRATSLGWTQEALLLPDEDHRKASFGGALDLDDGRLVVSTTTHEPIGTPDGAVYVFELQQDGTWEKTDVIRGPWHASWFGGGDVAIDGDRLAIGSPAEDALAGKAYVYERRADASWERIATFRSTTHEYLDRFGVSVAIDGATVAVGEVNNEKVNIFQEGEDGAWDRTAVLREPVEELHVSFGAEVELDGGSLFIGAPNIGAVYVAVDTPQGWTIGNVLAPPVPGGGHAFGDSIDAGPQYLVVGAPRSPASLWVSYHPFYPGVSPDVGAAYVYARADPLQGPVSVLQATPPGIEHRFGKDVAVGPSGVFVGAPGYEGDGSGFGFPRPQLAVG